MNGQVNPRTHYANYLSNEMGISALPMPSVSMLPVQLNEQDARMSPLMELTIVGGLGVLIMVAPNTAAFMKQKFQQIKTRVIILKDRMGDGKLAKKIELLNRRRKLGSLVRVIGTILPSSLFTPPCRIYIPNWAQLESNQWGFQPHLNLPIFEISKKPDLPSENDVGDGLIEAFEIESEVISNASGDEEIDDEEDNASSSPEGWTEEQRKLASFNPTIISITDSSFARCSTPKPNVKALHFNASHIVNQHGSRIYEDQEINDLRKMVDGLVSQMNGLSQSLLTTQNQLAAAQQQMPVTTPAQPVLAPLPSAPLPLPSSTNIPPPPSGLPPPPPPPPPPMPPMPSVGSNPLVITKKGNQDKLLEKKPQISLSDVLKELPNAKLRRIERSPGGTPLKPQLKLANEKMPLDIGNHLALALKKRYESMHSPVCETETDKENMDGSDDSFEDSPVSAKRILFPVNKSPRRKSGGIKQSENCSPSPFGQHLLKKRNLPTKEEGSPRSPIVLALREQN